MQCTKGRNGIVVGETQIDTDKYGIPGPSRCCDDASGRLRPVYVCISECRLCLYVCVSVSMCLHIDVYVCVRVSVCLYVSVSVSVTGFVVSYLSVRRLK